LVHVGSWGFDWRVKVWSVRCSPGSGCDNTAAATTHHTPHQCALQLGLADTTYQQLLDTCAQTCSVATQGWEWVDHTPWHAVLRAVLVLYLLACFNQPSAGCMSSGFDHIICARCLHGVCRGSWEGPTRHVCMGLWGGAVCVCVLGYSVVSLGVCGQKLSGQEGVVQAANRVAASA
jgi:hypothetical protein